MGYIKKQSFLSLSNRGRYKIKAFIQFRTRQTLYRSNQKSSLDQKILFLVSLETRQKRYQTQVITPFVNEEQCEMIKNRLKTRLDRNENAQVACHIDFCDKEGNIKFTAKGFADVVKDNIVYELKFVSELTHEHFLQCAVYMVAMNLEKGILWNTRDNVSYEIEVPDRKAFLDAVAKSVTKGMIENYYGCALFGTLGKKTQRDMIDKFAVIDTETNWNNEVMSIGIVIADLKTMRKVDSIYYIIDPEYKVGGMYSNELRLDGKGVCIAGRQQALKEIKQWMDTYHIQKLFAYNASFDKKHLSEYASYQWYDIMRLAAYRQYNSAIPDSVDCYRTGRLKRGYGVEDILRMLSKNTRYQETHNALLNAEDELQIMQLLGCEISEYVIAEISDKKAMVLNPQKTYSGSSKRKRRL